MDVLRTVREVEAALGSRPRPLGFVPTMGAFHAGHVALFEAARKECTSVVVSLFVNPAQFGERADLDRYPRDEARDAATAKQAGVDFLFAPSPEDMYPDGFETWVTLDTLGSWLEGAARPGHFRGVATVCLKLFNIVRPDAVYFGQKDAQQVEVIRRMLADRNLAIQLRVHPTVRDPDGLAMSSRNVRLSPADRERALALPRALATRDPVKARALLGGLEVEYLEVAPFDPPVLAAAVRVGGVRLIDNVTLEGHSR
jgi:pantoate--beta-alanine ligase